MLRLLCLVTFLVCQISAERSSYLDRFTTQSSGDVDRDTKDQQNRWGNTARRPSYQTDRWGDAVGGSSGSGTTEYRSPYVTWATDRPDRWSGSGGSSWDRTTDRYATKKSWLNREPTASWLDRDREPSGPKFDRDNAYVRVNVELIKLSNDKGISEKGGKCDAFGQCDPIIYGFLDTERPNAEFPGSRDSKYWPVIFQTDDNNSPNITNGNLTRDVCGAPYREATARFLIEDRDTLNSNDIIGKFDCQIPHEPDNSETFASWHYGSCAPKSQPDKIKLSFRYRVFVVSRSQCNPLSGALTTPKPKG